MQGLTLIQNVVIFAIPVLFAVTVHEVAHGWVAGRLGDPTARFMGRLTLNPFKHIDPLGTIVVPLLLLLMNSPVIGWAKPVPVDWRNLRHPRRDMALVAVAGPLSNLGMLLLWALLARVILWSGAGSSELFEPLVYMCTAGILINSILMLLNLIPVPPLDGSRVVSALLSPTAAYRYNQLEPYGLIIMVVLLVSGVLSMILSPSIQALLGVVSRLFGI